MSVHLPTLSFSLTAPIYLLYSNADGTQPIQIGLQRPLLALLDRNLDLATPLHHTWTYQALAHDVLVSLPHSQSLHCIGQCVVSYCGSLCISAIVIMQLAKVVCSWYSEDLLAYTPQRNCPF